MKNLLGGLKTELMELDENNMILQHDKRLLENLINKIVKSFHNRDMSRLITELVNISFSLNQLNSEKAKYEKQIIQMEREQQRLEENNGINFELKQTIMNERNSLKEMLIKQENKICNIIINDYIIMMLNLILI